MKEKIYSEIIIKMKAMKGIYQKFGRKALLLILVVKFAIISNAATYYVSNVGSDSNTGLSKSQPWKTVVKVNGFSFSSGDSILFKGGEVFTTRLVPVSGGIIISSYGTGMAEFTGHADVVGWSVAENWSEYTTGIYRLALPNVCNRLWINGNDSYRCQTLNLTNASPWRWESGYLYVKASSNPATYFTSMKVSSEQNRMIHIISPNTTIEKLKVSGASTCIRIQASNTIVEDCYIGDKVNLGGIFVYSSNAGITVNNVIIRNNILKTDDVLTYTYAKDPHTTGDAINLGNGTTNCKVYNNYIFGWSHAAIYMISLDNSYPFNGNEVYSNFITAPIIDYARAFGADYHSGGYNNSIHDNTVVNMSIGNQLNGNGLKFYNNIIDGIRAVPYTTKVGYGISMSGYATPATNMEIYSNTITNCIDFGIGIIWFTGTTIEKSNINIHDNNIFNNGTARPYGNVEYQLFVLQGSLTINHNTFSNNHFYSSTYANVIYYGGAALTTTQFNSASVNNDIISGNDALLKYGNYKTSMQNLRIEHNGTATAKTISIAQPMVDSKGNKYIDTVTIPKYSSLILLPDPTKYSIEYKSICEGTNYYGWNITGTYERTLKTESGSDSIVTTVLTVNPKYSISEDVTINYGETYHGWTTSGKYTRNLISVSGCDSIVNTDLTVVSTTIKQGSIAPSHFIPVWNGENGLNHMNLMVVSATLEDIPLSANDEIAVFSGSLCVGSAKLALGINPDDLNTYLSISASQNDGSTNGFTDNDTIIFKIWDHQNQKEMIAKAVKYRNEISGWLTNGKYVAGGTSVVEIVSYTEYTQSISLVKGYNMISTYLESNDANVSSLTKTLVDSGSLVKVQDETGNSYENWGTFGGWINNVGSVQKTEGYKIKVANNCTLQIAGRPIALPLDINLKAGWNIISFPRTDMIDALSIIQPLIDENKLVKVQDEKGNSIEDWGIYGGWKNGIGNFIPGRAYKIKMSADAVITIHENYTKSAVIVAQVAETEHFFSNVEGNGSDHMNINLVELKESGFCVGDELAAFDGDICVGALKLTEEDIYQNSVSIVVSLSTEESQPNGFQPGNKIRLFSWNNLSGKESEIQVESIIGQLYFEKNASMFARLKSASTETSNLYSSLVTTKVYPNPSKGKVIISFSGMPDLGSRIEVQDMSGRRIYSRQISGLTEEINLEQQPAGIYFVKTVFGSKEEVHKLILN